jgi:hypothetical protein
VTATRDDRFVALPKDVYRGSEIVLQSASGVHVCLGPAAVTVEPSLRHSVAPSPLQIRRIAGYVYGAIGRRYPTARLHQYGCLRHRGMRGMAQPEEIICNTMEQSREGVHSEVQGEVR